MKSKPDAGRYPTRSFATRTVIERTTGPVGTVPHTQCVAAPSSRRIQCPKCEKTFLESAVVECDTADDGDNYFFLVAVKQPFLIINDKTAFVPRMLYCDHCNHLVSWDEIYDVNNKCLTGRLSQTEKQIYLTDAEHINAFIRTFPQAAGVEQR